MKYLLLAILLPSLASANPCRGIMLDSIFQYGSPQEIGSELTSTGVVGQYMTWTHDKIYYFESQGKCLIVDSYENMLTNLVVYSK